MISHSQDFMNGVCTNIIHMANKKLKYYGVSQYGSFGNRQLLYFALRLLGDRMCHDWLKYSKSFAVHGLAIVKCFNIFRSKGQNLQYLVKFGPKKLNNFCFIKFFSQFHIYKHKSVNALNQKWTFPSIVIVLNVLSLCYKYCHCLAG